MLFDSASLTACINVANKRINHMSTARTTRTSIYVQNANNSLHFVCLQISNKLIPVQYNITYPAARGSLFQGLQQEFIRKFGDQARLVTQIVRPTTEFTRHTLVLLPSCFQMALISVQTNYLYFTTWTDRFPIVY